MELLAERCLHNSKLEVQQLKNAFERKVYALYYGSRTLL